LTFFGLNDNYIENVYEEMFLLKHYGGWSLFELYNLPISLRRWFLQRLNEEIERRNQQIEKAYKAK
jgi:hypothetical protein